MSLNSHYTVLFKNARDATQVANLARQMYLSKSKFMIEAFKNATSAPCGYLLINLKQETDDKRGLRTGIFPEMYSTFILENNKKRESRIRTIIQP